MDYRREIDGLRAVAVLPVILFHAGFKAFEGGFVGVDIFFVISGYLITTIILADMNKGKFSLVTFYERRARRILPVLFFVMLACLPFAWLWLLPNHLEDFAQSLTAVSVFSSNILFWRESGYFGTAAELKPLLHTWSLSVEEQYYVIFPLVLMALWRLRKRWIFGALVVFGATSLVVAQWGAYNKPVATFFLLPTRWWEIAIGALIAFYFLYKREQAAFIAAHKTMSEVFGSLGLGLILYAVLTFDETTPFPSLYALIPTLGTAFIILFATPKTLVGRLLSTKALVGIGLISYSTYLWHQPLFVFARHRCLAAPGLPLLLFLSGLSIVMAYFSWRYIEVPFRDKRAYTRKTIFVFAVVGSLAFVAIGAAGHFAGGFGERVNKTGVRLADIPGKVMPNHGLSEKCEDQFTLSADCRTSDRPEILVWGDSYAMHLVPGILASNPQAGIIQMTKSACGPFFDVAPVATKEYNVHWAEGCLAFNNSVRDWLKANKTVKYVVMSSSFGHYASGKKLLVDNTLVDAGRAAATRYLNETIGELKRMGVTPVVFSHPPSNGLNIGECLAKNAQFGDDLSVCDFSVDEVTAVSRGIYGFLEEVAAKQDVVFLNDGICADGRCKASIGKTFIYRDGGHLSREGSALIGRKMDFYGIITAGKGGKMAVAQGTPGST